MRAKRVCISWRRPLDDDMNCLFWKVLGKHLGKTSRWAEFLFVAVGGIVEQNGKFVVILGDWDRNNPECKVLRIDICKPDGILGLDELLEVIKS